MKKDLEARIKSHRTKKSSKQRHPRKRIPQYGTGSGSYYGPTTPEEVDERRERPWLYQEPSGYYGPTTPEEVDDRKVHPWDYVAPYDSGLSHCKWPDD